MSTQINPEHELYIKVMIRMLKENKGIHHAAGLAIQAVGTFREFFPKQVFEKTIETLRKDPLKEDFTLPWDEAPEWAMYAAMDGGGEWYWFKAEPNCLSDIWDVKKVNATVAQNYGPFNAPPFPGDWKDSLQERPE